MILKVFIFISSISIKFLKNKMKNAKYFCPHRYRPKTSSVDFVYYVKKLKHIIIHIKIYTFKTFYQIEDSNLGPSAAKATVLPTKQRYLLAFFITLILF